MSAIPVITAFGGISPAGRSACHHGFSRLVFDALPAAERSRVLRSLAALGGRAEGPAVLDDTLVRRLPDDIGGGLSVNLSARSGQPIELEMRVIDLPDPLPDSWQCESLGDKRVRVRLPADSEVLLPARQRSKVGAAGQLPGGFDPAAQYPSRNHPRALQMAIFGASETLGQLGLEWDRVRNAVAPHQIAVYASNLMSQLDDNGLGGMMKFPATGRRITSKQCPLGLGEMTADFINAYVLGTAGATGGMLGACATFLYNLQLGVQDIRSGRRRLVLVGTSEAPLVPEVIEGYRAMGALGEDDDLLALDPGRDTPDWRRACRPFGNNIGFTLAESAQFVMLMDDTLALELGADILAAVPDVFVHADGTKKSISAPGIGNYLTLTRAAALTRQLIGTRGLREQSFVHAHGTGTPQNRVTESHVLNETARAFGIRHWPVAAIKCYLGHSLASAGGDQLMATLGTFNSGNSGNSGLLPGIFTLDQVAEDVHASNLSFSREHRALDAPQAALLNSKGFGGNNATALVMSPQWAIASLRARHGQAAISAWTSQVERTREAIADFEQSALRGKTKAVYRFGEAVLEGEQLSISDSEVQLPGWASAVPLQDDPDWADLTPQTEGERLAR